MHGVGRRSLSFPKETTSRRKSDLRRAPNHLGHETSKERKGRMKRVILLLAILAAFLTAGVASAGIVDQEETTVGNNDVASVTLSASPHLTTAFAVGVWSSLEVAAPVHVTYAVVCDQPGNDRAGSFDLLAGRFVSDAAYIWIGSPAIAAPWYGWSHCQATVTLSQPGNGLEDHSLVAWLASHN